MNWQIRLGGSLLDDESQSVGAGCAVHRRGQAVAGLASGAGAVLRWRSSPKRRGAQMMLMKKEDGGWEK